MVAHSILVVLILIVIGLNLNAIPIGASTEVHWKTFKERNGLFTIKYPSNWAPYKYLEDSSAPINIFFNYRGPDAGPDASFAELSLFGEESIYSNASEVVAADHVYLQDEQNYEVLQETECGIYKIKNVSACHAQITYTDTDEKGKPTIKNLIIGAIDEDGIEYTLNYYVTEDLYDIFLPVAEEMIDSLNITSVISSSQNEQPSSDGLPELPPLT